jgi:hypothetical protein
MSPSPLNGAWRAALQGNANKALKTLMDAAASAALSFVGASLFIYR